MTLTYQDIPQFPSASYSVHVPWSYTERYLVSLAEGRGGLDLDPDFQRAHVWTEALRVWLPASPSKEGA